MTFPPPFYRWRPHPWHGLEAGPNAPSVVNAYIEITPYDYVKYEVDKITGYLRVDRPQPSSSQPPALYGFIPRTYCGDRVQALSPASDRGDADPLDICVIGERPINRADIIVTATVLGGLRAVDGGEADDKIIAVLENDHIWSGARDVSDVPEALIERLRHYFATYKLKTGESSRMVIETTYGRAHALKVIEASMQDYDEAYGQ